jgi:hypothetical protein
MPRHRQPRGVAMAVFKVSTIDGKELTIDMGRGCEIDELIGALNQSRALIGTEVISPAGRDKMRVEVVVPASSIRGNQSYGTRQI